MPRRRLTTSSKNEEWASTLSAAPRVAMGPRDALVDGEFITADGEEFELVAADGYERAGLELLEVDDDILDEIVSSDGFVRFKGGPDDVAVVCTKSKTYQVKRVETSNQLLIVGPPLRGEEDDAAGDDAAGEAEASGKKRATVRAEARSHLDLTEIAPKLDRLRSMMASVAYGGEDEMETGEGDGFDFEALDERVQASETQILACLNDELAAIEIDGKWRGVKPEYRLHALSMLAVSASGNGWPRNALPEADVVDAMVGDGFIPEMARNTLHAFASPNEDGVTWTMDEEKVSRALVERVLRDGTGLKQWRLADVMDAWRAKMNENGLGDVEIKEEYLAGMALIERSDRSDEAFVRTLVATDLSREPELRFKSLWEVKPRWTLAELEPYLKGQERPGQNIQAQLLKYCRVTQGTPPVYSKR